MWLLWFPGLNISMKCTRSSENFFMYFFYWTLHRFGPDSVEVERFEEFTFQLWKSIGGVPWKCWELEGQFGKVPQFCYFASKRSVVLFYELEVCDNSKWNFLFIPKAIGHIYAQQRQTEKAIDIFKKVTRIDPKDSQVNNCSFYTLSCSIYS